MDPLAKPRGAVSLEHWARMLRGALISLSSCGREVRIARFSIVALDDLKAWLAVIVGSRSVEVRGLKMVLCQSHENDLEWLMIWFHRLA